MERSSEIAGLCLYYSAPRLLPAYAIFEPKFPTFSVETASLERCTVCRHQSSKSSLIGHNFYKVPNKGYLLKTPVDYYEANGSSLPCFPAAVPEGAAALAHCPLQMRMLPESPLLPCPREALQVGDHCYVSRLTPDPHLPFYLLLAGKLEGLPLPATVLLHPLQPPLALPPTLHGLPHCHLGSCCLAV